MNEKEIIEKDKQLKDMIEIIGNCRIQIKRIMKEEQRRNPHGQCVQNLTDALRVLNALREETATELGQLILGGVKFKEINEK